MQGQRRSRTTLPESLSFDHAAMPGDTGIESQMTWSSLQTSSAQNRLEEIRLSANGTNVPYLRRVRIGMPNAQWSSGETSSAAAQNHVNGNQGKTEQHSRTFQSRSGLNVISVENDELDLNGSQAPTCPFVLPNSGSDAISQDLNMIFGDDDEDPTRPFVLTNSGSDAISQDLNMIFGDEDEDDDCQIVERPSTYVSLGSSSVLGNEDRRGFSSDGKRVACKRKAFEVEGIQTSGGGSSSSSKNAERRCQWRPVPAKAIELDIGKSSSGGSSSSSKNAERRYHWRQISTKATEMQVGQSSGGGSSSSSKNAERCHWRPIPTKAVGVQAGQSSGVGGSSSSQNAERGNWGPMPAKAVEVQVGQSSGVGASTSSQNAERGNWGPMPAKAVEVQVGQSSGVGGSNSSQNPERSHWVPVPAKAFEVQVGRSSGVESSNSSQNVERSNWVRDPAKAIKGQVGQSSNASQNEMRCHWIPISEKALGVQAGQSSGAGGSSSSQSAERCRWVPVPAATFTVQAGQSSGAGISNSSQNEERCRWVSIPEKAFQVQFGQTSGPGSSNSSQNEERCQVPMPADHMASRSVTLPTQNEPVSSNSSEHANPRLRLGVGGTVSEGPFSRITSGNTESSRRNIRVRINGSPYQDPIASDSFAAEADVGTRDIPSTRHSARLLRNNVLDLNPAPPLENGGSPHEQYTASVRRNSQTRWSSRASSSRNTRSSTPAIPEPTATNIPIPRSISEHPIFVPAVTEIGSLSEHPTGWSVTNGNNTTAETVASGVVGSSTGVNLSSAAWSHRSRLERPRRLSEIVRRSALLSAGSDSGSQGPTPAIGSSSSLTPEEMALLSGSHLHDRVATSSRSAILERNLDLPYSLRNLATASEGRSSSIMSEIRHVLNLMRRGEGLRFEDVMLLDQSVFAGMADMHDRHRDMRLDVDNMSYEELLALEERIGNVCTGLTVETIMKGLKQRKYAENGTKDQVDTEPCSICREEYNHGEDLGTLECGHDFHRDCIKQWLVQKNSCPICKKTGLST